MLLRDYLKIIGQAWKSILIIIVMVILATAIFTKLAKSSYDSMISLTVNKISPKVEGQTNYYQYDSYYAISSADYLANIIQSWVSSPAVVNQVFSKAQIELPKSSLKKLSKVFRAVKQGQTPVVDISYQSNNVEESKKLLTEFIGVIKEKAKNYQINPSADLLFDIQSTEPVVVESRPSMGLNLLLGLLGGAILGICWALLVDHIKSPLDKK
jgi:capsular polysaccharide biosynthesis protein